MKTNWKSIVAGLVLAFASTPLLAASTVSAEQVKVEAQVVVSEVEVDDTLYFSCTARWSGNVNGRYMTIEATAATCGQAVAMIEQMLSE